MRSGAFINRQLSNPTGFVGWLVGRLMSRVNAKPNRLAIAALKLRPEDRVLELGYGPGEGIAAICRVVTNGRVIGIDHSVAMLRQARRRNAKAVRDLRATLFFGDFTPLPVQDAYVDKILAVNVAYFWHDSDAVLAEVRRVLKPGGRIAIYVTEGDSLASLGLADARTHRTFNMARLREMLISGGFAGSEVKLDQVRFGDSLLGIIATAVKRPSGDDGAAAALVAKGDTKDETWTASRTAGRL